MNHNEKIIHHVYNKCFILLHISYYIDLQNILIIIRNTKKSFEIKTKNSKFQYLYFYFYCFK